jgi:deoxyribose-phosphate aldolase
MSVPCPWSHDRLAAVLDHTLLDPAATPDRVDRLCDEAREHAFAAVCVNGVYVPRCSGRLVGSGVAVCAVIGFPLGAGATEAKAAEARIALEDGATELDMVLQVGAFRSGDREACRQDIEAVVDVARPREATVKVILETGLLTPDEIPAAARLCVTAGADYVKTSTGFGPRGASVEDVRLMRAAVGPEVGVKAAGGIRTRAFALQLLEAGATRLGCSASVAIVTEAHTNR